MNALANGIAHAPANALAHASSAGSVDAKGRERKGPDRTTPNGVFALGEFPIHLSLGDVALILGMKVVDKFRTDGWDENLVVPELGPCWEYRGSRSPHNYGVTRQVLSHRLAVMLDGRPIPDGMHVLHECDNPPCVNPSHLKVGTRYENMRDMVARGRNAQARGDNHYAAHITDAQVEQIRTNYTGAWGEAARLAREFDVSSNHMLLILTGKRRVSAGGPISAGPRAIRAMGETR